jgi:membrane-associated protein
MRYRVFVTYNIMGAVLWGAGVTLLGYYLGEIEFVKNNIEVAIVVIVALSLLPVAIELLKHRREAKHAAASTPAAVRSLED